MAISAVQNVTNTNTTGTTIAATFGATPTVNNLGVATIQSNDGTCTNETGWSTAIDIYNATEDDFARIAYKVFGASESATVTFTGFAGNTKLLGLSEWTGNATASPLDQTASTGRTTGATSISSGTTATTAQADELAVAVQALRALNGGGLSYTNSFSGFHNLNNGSAFSGLSATKILSAAAAIETTFSWTTSGTTWAGIATFKASGGAATTRGMPFGQRGTAFNGSRTFEGNIR